MIAAVTVREPEFAESDRLTLLASRRLERQPRGRHGHPLSEASDVRNQYRWKARKPRRDYAQAAINAAQKNYQRLYPEADHDSLLWGVELDPSSGSS